MRGPFITLEGQDGAGKSSHEAILRQALKAAGWDVVMTKEPGGSDLGARLRLELKETPMDLSTEVFIAFAARCEHLAQVIRPALAAGKAVISDRFTDSTFAYQGASQGYPTEKLEKIEQIVQDDLRPDLTLFFDVSPEVAAARRTNRLATDATVSATDKFDNKDAAFFEAVRQGYLDRIAKSPERYVVIDGNPSLELVAAQVQQALAQFTQRFRNQQTPEGPTRRIRRSP